MSDIEVWNVTYREFQKCADKLTAEIDRLTIQTRNSRSILDSSGKIATNIEVLAQQIQDQVKKAEQSWAKGDEMAERAAMRASSSAITGIQMAVEPLIGRLSETADNAEKTVIKMNISAKSTRRSIYFLTSGFLLINLLVIGAGSYWLKSYVSKESDNEIDARLFAKLLINATPKEKTQMLQILDRKADIKSGQ